MMPEGIDLTRIVTGLSHSPVVYFLRSGNTVKIGTSTRLRERVNSLSLSLSDLALIVPGGEDVERAYHARFARQRIQDDREWFRIAGALLTFLSAHEPPPPPRRRVIPRARKSETDLGVGLAEACDSGVLTVSLASARAARNRDRRFPAPVGQDGGEFIYDPTQLTAWERGRPRAGIGQA